MGSVAERIEATDLWMNSVYFLVPGLRVPENVWDEAIQGADFSALATLFEDAEPVLEQRLVQTPVLAGATHLLWLWEVLSKTKSMPEMAAFVVEKRTGDDPAHGALARHDGARRLADLVQLFQRQNGGIGGDLHHGILRGI